MKSTIRTTLLALSALVPAAASAVYTQTVTTSYSFGTGLTSGTCGAGGGIGCLAGQLIYLINNILVPLLFAIAFKCHNITIKKVNKPKKLIGG